MSDEENRERVDIELGMMSMHDRVAHRNVMKALIMDKSPIKLGKGSVIVLLSPSYARVKVMRGLKERESVRGETLLQALRRCLHVIRLLRVQR